MRMTSIVYPIIGIVAVLFLLPLIIQLGGNAATAAQTAFNVTVDVGGNQYNIGGVAALIIMLAMIFVPIAVVERFLRGG